MVQAGAKRLNYLAGSTVVFDEVVQDNTKKFGNKAFWPNEVLEILNCDFDYKSS
ncbi:hypothetical protein [Arsenicibacter rosenii]|uniref:hypothetical protein n=1 Tax=Arsenicibacter rosenii TaxID=1750698 RepID=UPI0015A523BC|nr:hypothetical protein [Arsenicibacter rosenii]